MYEKPGVAPEIFPGGALPDIGATISETLNEFTENIGAYALAGLSMALIMIPAVLAMLFGVYMLLASVILGGAAGASGFMAILPSEMAGIGGLLGVLLAIAIAVVGMTVVMGMFSAVIAPLNASLLRSIAAHQRGEGPLEFSAPFRAMGENLGSVILGTTLLTLLGAGLAMMCYLPALLPMIFLSFAAPLIALHNRSAMGGIGMAFRHAKNHLGWHLKYGFTHLLVLMVSSQIPVVGYMFAIAFQVRMYRKVFGDGQEPVLV
jgi:hypothetical protein